MVFIIIIFFFLCLVRYFVSLFIDVVLFVFCKFVISIIVGGWVVRLSFLFVFFIIDFSLDWMILINIWLGLRFLVILVLIVCFFICVINVFIMGSVMLVLSSVICILCSVFLILFLVRCFLLLIFCNVWFKCFDKFLNIVWNFFLF